MRVLAVLLIAIPLVGCYSSPPPPSDEQLIRVFHNHKKVFQALVAKICGDHYEVVSMDPEWSRPDNIPKVKKEQYYRLFRKIGVVQLQSYDGCRAQLSVWAVGWAGSSGDYKDFEYRPTHVENVVKSLDDLPLTNKIQIFYRKIAPNWYLRYAHWP